MDAQYADALRHAFVEVDLVSAGGELTLSSDGDFRLRDGVEGLGAPSIDYTSAPLAKGGGVFRHTRFEEPEIFLPIQLRAPSPAGLYERRRELESVILHDIAEPVEVRVRTRHNSDVRSRLGYLTGGQDYTLGGSDSHFTWHMLGLTFSCPDAFWYGAPRMVEWELSAALKPFLSHPIGGMASPFFPVILSESTVQGAHQVVVQGDAPTQAVITVEGPGRDLVVENSTTGERVMVEGEVRESITLDGERGDVYSASLTQGELWDQLSADSSPGLISLAPGVNSISVAMVDADPRSKVTVTYRERFRAGH